MTKTFLLFAAILLPLAAQVKQPEPAPLPPPIPTPRDQPYVGPIQITVDITDVQRRIITVHETIPVRQGALTLLYPEWLPGDHAPSGPIENFAGLVVKANDRPLNWVRDRVDVYAFHIQVPEAVNSIKVEFQYLCPEASSQGRVSMSNKLVDLSWTSTILYPGGYFSRRIEMDPTLIIPAGWKFASALEVESEESGHIRFKRTPLNTFADSPLYAGENYTRIDLTTGPDNIVHLNVFGDTPESVAMTPQLVQLHKNLAIQAQKLFASHHYNHYDFLFSLSDTVGEEGLEHHQSSEDGLKANYLTKWDEWVPERDLLAHEYTHSWNGKFRRPADLWTPNYSVPMQDDLLWVYEGLTQYWGYVLTARSGLRTAEETRDLIARVAANFAASPGRDWRPLVDTTNQEIMSHRRRVPWVSWLRPEDYYTEGLLIWLDADTKIRELSGGKKSLDDFAKTFYGVENGSFVTDTYTFDDVVRGLNAVQPFDWDHFLKARVYEVRTEVPEEGITRGGYRLAYTDTAPDWLKKMDSDEVPDNYGTGIGFSVDKDGILQNVWWNSPAFKAGMTSEMKITAVNGVAFKRDGLKQALLNAEKSSGPIHFLLKRGDRFETIDVDYHGGLRYPKLERVEGQTDLLDEVLAPVQ